MSYVPEGFVLAYDKNTGRKLHVPAAWLEQSIFPNIVAAPSVSKKSRASKAEKATDESPVSEEK